MNFRGNTGAYLHDFKVGSEELVDRLIVFGLTDSILSNGMSWWRVLQRRLVTRLDKDGDDKGSDKRQLT